ncbi:hypothetical protein ABK905_10630 [Acerihabitans sp. KWT182]|uniref:Uncharacterized protein n=1 Tax=Acerihabitans sp. KWT182 TaxID=3157919 RepID=A0AAU7QE66_9GAMM
MISLRAVCVQLRAIIDDTGRFSAIAHPWLHGNVVAPRQTSIPDNGGMLSPIPVAYAWRRGVAPRLSSACRRRDIIETAAR